MPALRRGLMLRIYLDEQQRHDHHLLYEEIVQTAHDSGLASAVVLRGITGFAPAGGKVHSSKILRMNEHLPLVIEIADRAEAIETFLATQAELLSETIVVRQVIKIAVPPEKAGPGS